MEQRCFLGESSIENLLLVLKEFSFSHLFLVRGRNSYETCGAKSIMTAVFSELDCEVTEYFDFEENPKIEDLERGLLLLRKYSCSVIVAVGGGSVLDMAKLLRFFYSYSGEPTSGKFEKEKDLLPLIVLPTTAGTGSEATHFAVLYKNKVKYSVEHNAILPDVAIVYPPFTYNTPRYLTACAGFDALAQAIEAYWNAYATKESDEFAKRAIELLWPNLPLVVNSPTNSMRNKVSEGAYWAGRAINITKTTAPHAFSYSFTTYYGYPHGHAVAMTFPFFWSINMDIHRIRKNISPSLYKQKIEYLKNLCNIDIGDYIEKRILLPLKLPENFNKYFILESVNRQRLQNNPVDLDDFRGLL